MYTLRLLGGCALFDDAGAVVWRLSQRRAEAVLAVLGVTGAPGCTRDHLLGLLWPENPDELARHSLRSALHVLRTAVHPDIILTAGDDVRLNPSLVACDVTLMRAAHREGRLADAVALYDGPFLDGFHVDQAVPFERWLEDERSRLFHECADALEMLATRAEQAGDVSGAAAWWIQATEHDPDNTRIVIRLIRSLVAAGDRGNALLHAEAHRRRLWMDLQIEPDAAFAQEVAKLKGIAPHTAQRVSR